ncbi:MAG: outer membrane protein assembly factor BamA [Treponema sp.]|nr:outer membrane protein assembly factor BamA [Treponema sp.]
MKRRFLSVLFVTLAVVIGAYAQETENEDWYLGQPITKVEFEGLKKVHKSDLAGITNDCIDELFTEEVYLDLVDRLFALDLFDEIEPYAKHDSRNRNNVVLVIKVVESPVINKISFEGNRKIRNGELRELIKTKTTDVFVESKILLDERLIRDHYLEKGYSDSKISHRVVTNNDGMEVIFTINEGFNTVIKEIHTSGNSIVSERVLKGKLKLKEIGFLKDGAFQNTTLEQDKRTILAYYLEKGYVDADIVDVKITKEFNEDKERQEMTINFIIQEGSQYKYSGLQIVGNQIFTTKQLIENMKLKKGDVFNQIKFEEGLSGITNVYYENGYMTNEFIPIPNKDTENKTIGYTLNIRENSRSRIENIIIKGNSKTKDYVIRREIPLEPGDVFSRDKVINGMRNLYNLQYFSNIVPDVQSGSEANLVDLVLSVEEQSTTTLNFGMTFSGVTDPNEWPISLYFRIENSNVFGEGKSLAATVNVSNIEQSIDLSYAQGWLFGLPISYSQTLSFSHASSYARMNMFLPDMTLDQYYYYLRYNSWKASLSTGFGRRWSPDFAILTLSGGITDSITNYIYDENLYTPTDIGTTLFSNRWGILNTLWGAFSMDGRDINFDPSKGWFISEKLGWNGVIPGLEREFFLRSETIGELYGTLFDIPVSESFNFKGVLAFQSSFIGLFPLPGTSISESNRVYIDGIINGRGWDTVYLDTNGKGQAMWSNKLEFRVPIVPGVVGADFFHDAAIVRPNVQDMFTNLSIENFYFSYGPGIRILMQQLPLHLMFCFKYQIIDGKYTWAPVPFQFILSFNLTNK